MGAISAPVNRHGSRPGSAKKKAPWMFASGATPQPTHHTHALNNCHQKRHPNVWLRHTATLGPGNDASSNLRKQKPPTQNHVLPAPQMFNVASQGLLSLGRIYAAWQVLEGCFNGNFESRGRGGGGFFFCFAEPGTTSALFGTYQWYHCVVGMAVQHPIS